MTALKGWDVEQVGGEAQDGGGICIFMTDSHCMARIQHNAAAIISNLKQIEGKKRKKQKPAFTPSLVLEIAKEFGPDPLNCAD